MRLTPAQNPQHANFLKRLTSNKVITATELAMLALFSIFYYLLFHGVANLHDISHYLMSGVVMLRDHVNLIYPYSSMNPGSADSYNYFQANSQLVDLHKSYPSKLYSILISLFYLATGKVRFYQMHIVTIAALLINNYLLYLTAQKFFQGANRFLFIAVILFTPAVGAVILPSNDIFCLLCSTFFIWAILCKGADTLIIGLTIGLLTHLRSQNLFFIFLFPIFWQIYSSENLLSRKNLICNAKYIVGFLTSYLVISIIFNQVIAPTDGGGIEYYYKNFLASTYGLSEYRTLLTRLITNIANLSGSNSLSIFFFTGMYLSFFGENKTIKALAATGIVFAIFPMLVYTFDRTADPAPRYYSGAIPFLVLSLFLAIKNKLEQDGVIQLRAKYGLIFAIVLVGWFHNYGIPSKELLKAGNIMNRLTFLDIENSQEILSKNFNKDDLIVTNNSYPSGISALHNFLPYPSFGDFINGDNSEVAGIVFIYSNEGANVFFKPTDWFKDGQLPTEIDDRFGNHFQMIANKKNDLVGRDGSFETTVYFVVYKNTANIAIHTDTSGERIFSTNLYKNYTYLKNKSPEFENASDWKGVLTHPQQGPGVLVGPGYANANVLVQRIPVVKGEKLLLEATAYSINNKVALGRLQINWMDTNSKFMGTSITRIKVDKSPKTFKDALVVPDGVAWGDIYVTPDILSDSLIYTSVRLFSDK